MECRDGETETSKFRANRYFCISGQWFFSTREHLQVGPFPTQDDAEMELSFFLRHMDEWGRYANPYKTDFSGLRL
ncbi:MAG: DUF6316 family protein [Oceanicoccus sp.]